jgi:hypothetical protein
MPTGGRGRIVIKSIAKQRLAQPKAQRKVKVRS